MKCEKCQRNGWSFCGSNIPKVAESGSPRWETTRAPSLPALSPADPVYLAYLTRGGAKNDYQEFLLSPECIEAGEDAEKLLIPSPLLEQANLSPGEDIQILCLDRAIVLCETSTLDRNDLEAILQQLRAAQELAFSLPEEAGSLIHQLEQIIQEGAIGHEAAE